MKKLYWLIEGHDSFKTFFEMKVGIGQFTSDQIDQLLKALVAKAGLTYSEIVSAYATRRTKIANNLLAVLFTRTTPWLCVAPIPISLPLW